ncbi:MAG: RIP metalloprotease RseP [Rhodovulum sulfidophilum]|uniref:Zinc metalloprotease n=1 Tax=Rhodovulum sulfidophilum TaxID=35806 RepID=A0A2W5N884_RHOSU|nr:MAG: RIP metalloprotease RseP [Rhodovulum sulfidophilum]
MTAFLSVLPSIAIFIGIVLALVAAHELGHLIVGRRFGIRPTVFSVGFGRALWERRDRSGLIWRLGLLPLGGYVRFEGDDLPSGAANPAPGSLPAAGIPARIAMFAAGPITNILLGAMLFAIAAALTPVAQVPLTVGEVQVAGSALRAGDEIVAIDGAALAPGGDLLAISRELPSVDPHVYDLRRGDTSATIEALHPYPAVIATVAPGRAAARAGLRPGDRIVSINGAPVDRLEQLAATARASGGAPLDLIVTRDGALLAIQAVPEPRESAGGSAAYALGITGAPLFQIAMAPPTAATAIAQGAGETVGLAGAVLAGTWDLVAGRHGVCALGGPVELTRLSGVAAAQGPVVVLRLAAALSVVIAIMNLLPVPMLDGGRIVLLVAEAVRGKPVPDRTFRALMAGSLALLMALMIVATLGDVFC